jgi:hypothetical protein
MSDYDIITIGGGPGAAPAVDGREGPKPRPQPDGVRDRVRGDMTPWPSRRALGIYDLLVDLRP